MVEYLLKQVFGQVTFGRTNQKGKTTFIPLLKLFWREQISQWSFPKLTFTMNNKSRCEVAIPRRLLFFLQTLSPHPIFYCLYIQMKNIYIYKVKLTDYTVCYFSCVSKPWSTASNLLKLSLLTYLTRERSCLRHCTGTRPYVDNIFSKQ